MTASLKRLFLIAISLIVIPLVALSLWSSLTEPQITDRLQLYQTDLLLHVNELDTGSESENLLAARKAILGDDPLKTATEQYQEVRKSAQTNLQKFQTQVEQAVDLLPPEAMATDSISKSAVAARTAANNLQKQQVLLNQLDLRIGLLQVQQNQQEAAQTTWQQVEASKSDITPDMTEAEEGLVRAIGLQHSPTSPFPVFLKTQAPNRNILAIWHSRAVAVPSVSSPAAVVCGMAVLAPAPSAAFGHAAGTMRGSTAISAA